MLLLLYKNWQDPRTGSFQGQLEIYKMSHFHLKNERNAYCVIHCPRRWAYNQESHSHSVLDYICKNKEWCCIQLMFSVGGGRWWFREVTVSSCAEEQQTGVFVFWKFFNILILLLKLVITHFLFINKWKSWQNGLNSCLERTSCFPHMPSKLKIP